MKLSQSYSYFDHDPKYREYAIVACKQILGETLMAEILRGGNGHHYDYTAYEEERVLPFIYASPQTEYRLTVEMEEAKTSTIWITKLDYDYKVSTMPRWLKTLLRWVYPND